MDEPTKLEVGDPILDGVKDKYSLEKFYPAQARELSPQEKEDFMVGLPTVPNPPDMVPHMKFILEKFQQLLPEVKGPETLSLSQFFNRTVSEFKDVDCSDDDLAEYQSFTETDGVVGRSATLTDYLIARTFQHVVQERYMLEFTIAQLAQIRVDLKQAKRLVGYNQYRPFFNLLHTRASGTKTGEVDANSALDDVLLIIKHLSPIVADPRTPEDTKEFLSTHGSKKLMILRMVRRSFYESTKTDQDYIYDREFGRKTLEDRFPAFAFTWEPMFGENVNMTKINVAAQLELIEWIDMAVASLP
ncbi:hypothetical protein V498_07752 [Pseudogymnoascus sp. VKM F-4517 (FW-2822)]|nr:hypothetical protein V498_07752 [Pseudogymnoascus sp. VKM F-4517 (FW-2822)]